MNMGYWPDKFSAYPKIADKPMETKLYVCQGLRHYSVHDEKVGNNLLRTLKVKFLSSLTFCSIVENGCVYQTGGEYLHHDNQRYNVTSLLLIF